MSHSINNCVNILSLKEAGGILGNSFFFTKSIFKKNYPCVSVNICRCLKICGLSLNGYSWWTNHTHVWYYLRT